MLNFVKENYLSIIFVIAIVVTFVILIKRGYKKQIKQCLLYLVTNAEKEYGGKTGKLKFSKVSNDIYSYLPSLAKMFISSKMIEELINKAVEEMEEYLKKDDDDDAEQVTTEDVTEDVTE